LRYGVEIVITMQAFVDQQLKSETHTWKTGLKCQLSIMRIWS